MQCTRIVSFSHVNLASRLREGEGSALFALMQRGALSTSDRESVDERELLT